MAKRYKHSAIGARRTSSQKAASRRNLEAARRRRGKGKSKGYRGNRKGVDRNTYRMAAGAAVLGGSLYYGRKSAAKVFRKGVPKMRITTRKVRLKKR